MIYPRAMCTALYTARWSLFMTISFLIMPTSPQQPAPPRQAFQRSPDNWVLSQVILLPSSHRHVSDNTYMVLDVQVLGIKRDLMRRCFTSFINKIKHTTNQHSSTAPGSFRIRMVRVVWGGRGQLQRWLSWCLLVCRQFVTLATTTVRCPH